MTSIFRYLLILFCQHIFFETYQWWMNSNKNVLWRKQININKIVTWISMLKLIFFSEYRTVSRPYYQIHLLFKIYLILLIYWLLYYLLFEHKSKKKTFLLLLYYTFLFIGSRCNLPESSDPKLVKSSRFLIVSQHSLLPLLLLLWWLLWLLVVAITISSTAATVDVVWTLEFMILLQLSISSTPQDDVEDDDVDGVTFEVDLLLSWVVEATRSYNEQSKVENDTDGKRERKKNYDYHFFTLILCWNWVWIFFYYHYLYLYRIHKPLKTWSCENYEIIHLI